MRVRIREHEAALVAVDRPQFAAGVTGQARVAGGMNVAGEHWLAHPETRGCNLAVRGAAGCDHSRHDIRGEWRGRFGRTRPGAAASDPPPPSPAALDQ